MKCQWMDDCGHDALLMLEHPEDGPIPACGFCAQREGQPWRDLPPVTDEDVAKWERRADDVAKARKNRMAEAAKQRKAEHAKALADVKSGKRGKMEVRPRKDDKKKSSKKD